MGVLRRCRRWFAALPIAVLAGLPAAAEDPSYDAMWRAALAKPCGTITEYADHLVVKCDDPTVHYLFTKPAHPAHPGVIEERLFQDAFGKWKIRTEGYAFGSTAPSPAFERWLAEIIERGAAARRAMEREPRPAPRP